MSATGLEFAYSQSPLAMKVRPWRFGISPSQLEISAAGRERRRAKCRRYRLHQSKLLRRDRVSDVLCCVCVRRRLNFRPRRPGLPGRGSSADAGALKGQAGNARHFRFSENQRHEHIIGHIPFAFDSSSPSSACVNYADSTDLLIRCYTSESESFPGKDLTFGLTWALL